jgi:hypothetical protein
MHGVRSAIPATYPLTTAEWAMLRKQVLRRDDTPVSVLAPGAGKTKIGCLWVYMLDERPYDGKHSPAAAFFYSAVVQASVRGRI